MQETKERFMSGLARLGYSTIFMVIVAILLTTVELKPAQEATFFTLAFIGFLFSVAGSSDREE